ncbi:hypothetical protein ACFSKU_15950 [Pontibacter silvestris]|uniref:Uncharacterized protein n=1 Tax=Pontibacter silvestris TaxID=2305183 RepID=A0ABW4X1H8_9BACT|nr:hypothetical protein [Pontibacter silvestris]MCC9135963.1 hypothetical protein [Pontibacter silvestris]
MKIKHTNKIFAALFTLSFFLMSCDKEESMVVDRVESPVLITISGTSFLASEPVNVTATVYELDKSGILDHTVGIDSIPVSNLPLKIIANGMAMGDLTTDAAGKVNLTKTWAELGFSSPQAGNAVNLEWSGSYQGQAFTKLSKVQVKEE